MVFSTTNNLIHTLGNIETFDDLIRVYCSRIQKNEVLKPFFGNFDSNSLVTLEKVFLVAAFANLTSKDKQDQLHRRVALLYHRLFELGLNGIHFDVLKHLFLVSLQEFSTNMEVYESCSANFESLRYLFEKTGTDSIYSGKDHLLDRRSGMNINRTRSESTCNPLVVGREDPKAIRRSRSGDVLLNMFRSNKEKKTSIRRNKSGDMLLNMFRSNKEKKTIIGH
eukprot:scaffold9174_cov80-Cylindrotheca_fusiformis.AAC.3